MASVAERITCCELKQRPRLRLRRSRPLFTCSGLRCAAGLDEFVIVPAATTAQMLCHFPRCNRAFRQSKYVHIENHGWKTLTDCTTRSDCSRGSIHGSASTQTCHRRDRPDCAPLCRKCESPSCTPDARSSFFEIDLRTARVGRPFGSLSSVHPGADEYKRA